MRTPMLAGCSMLLLSLAVPTGQASAQGAACRLERCSGHGTCMEERAEAFCFCDEGYRAEGLRCVVGGATHDPDHPPTGSYIVSVALAEVGRDLPAVGSTRTDGPGPLMSFLRPDALWCSDFVSWVYRVAGVPFSGGYRGGWHLTSNQMIRSWYERRGMYVAKGTPAWRDVRPLPGDYVRISTRTWGHSAIVRNATATTLYTIEGNASGRVITTQYENWRVHERIDGFGLTTFGAGRMNGMGR